MRLENKVAIVTGGAQGLGEAYSIGMAREGASVVIADVDEPSGHKLEKLIRNSGGKALFVSTDVSRKADTEAMVQKAIKEFGCLDIIVNNAGILFSAPVEDTTEEMWDKQFAVNVKGLFFCCQAASEVMKKQKRGRLDYVHTVHVKGPYYLSPGFLPWNCASGTCK